LKEKEKKESSHKPLLERRVRAWRGEREKGTGLYFLSLAKGQGEKIMILLSELVRGLKTSARNRAEIAPRKREGRRKESNYK